MHHFTFENKYTAEEGDDADPVRKMKKVHAFMHSQSDQVQEDIKTTLKNEIHCCEKYIETFVVQKDKTCTEAFLDDKPSVWLTH